MDEQEVERRVRAGLEQRAGRADVTAPVVDRVRGEVGRRRRTRWAVGAAAAAVVLVVGGTAVATRDDDATGPPVADDPTGSVTEGGAGAWRTEHWADVAVDVPADWGYGGAPLLRDGTACYPEAMVGPDGERVDGGHGLGYVGRPIAGTDVCALVPRAWEPAAPYVWLGAVVEPGTVDYDNGFVQETVEVDGSTVTVGARDAALRQRILDSARGGELCMSELDARPRPADGGEQHGTGITVCAYRRVAGAFQLTYAAEVPAEQSFDATVDAAGPVAYRCARARHGDLVVLTTARSRYVVELSCPGILHPDGTQRALTPENVAPWAVGGIPAIVHGEGVPEWAYRYFIGPQG